MTGRRSGDSAKLARTLVWLIVPWLVLPTAFRVVFLLDAPWSNGVFHGLLGTVLGLCLGATQDLAICAQVLALALLARTLSGRLSAVFVGVCFALIQLYCVLDFLLFINIDLRMTASFFHFVGDAEAFSDSIEDAGAVALLGALVVLVAGTVFIVRRQTHGLALLKPNRNSVLVFFTAHLFGALGLLYAPGELMYLSNNILFNDEVEGIEVLLGREDELLNAALEADGEALWRPPLVHERFEREAGALLTHRTLGFEGEKHFELRVGDDKPNVVVLVMESFRAKDIGVLGGTYPITPNFDRLSKQGILFSNFYATGVQTTRAVISALFGVMPRFSEGAVQADWPDIPLRGMADLMKEAGYHTAYIHNGELDFESMGAFFEAHGYDEIMGEEDMLRLHPGAPRFSWGVHDEVLMEVLLDWLETKQREAQPSFVVSFTISNHHPWELPSSWEPIDLPVPANETYGRFLRAMHYSDHALGAFIDGLAQRGLAENTIVFVLADTSQAMGDRDDNYSVSRNLFYENVRIPLLILAKGRLDAPRVVEEVGGEVDLLPTLLDILGLEGVHSGIGSSLVRVDPTRSAFFQSPFALRYWGVRQGRWKFFTALKSGERHLYDVVQDPGETVNLAATHPEKADALYLAVARMHRLFTDFYSQPR